MKQKVPQPSCTTVPTSQGAVTRRAAVSRQLRRSGSATRLPSPSAAAVDTPGAGSSSGVMRGGAAKSTRSENGTYECKIVI